jgi:hypothetical protein
MISQRRFWEIDNGLRVCVLEMGNGYCMWLRFILIRLSVAILYNFVRDVAVTVLHNFFLYVDLLSSFSLCRISTKLTCTKSAPCGYFPSRGFGLYYCILTTVSNTLVLNRIQPLFVCYGFSPAMAVLKFHASPFEEKEMMKREPGTTRPPIETR